MTADRSEAGTKIWAAPTLEELTINLSAIAAKKTAAADAGKGTHSKS